MSKVQLGEYSRVKFIEWRDISLLKDNDPHKVDNKTYTVYLRGINETFIINQADYDTIVAEMQAPKIRAAERE